MAPLPRTSAGGRLADLAGLSPREYLRAFDRANLLQTFPGRTRRDDSWPIRDARIAAAAMKPLLAGRRVILVGRNVATAFGFPAIQMEFHEWARDDKWDFDLAVVPHTSGRSHWYRKEGNEARARRFWAEALGERGEIPKLRVAR